jgi:hypothetical protein
MNPFTVHPRSVGEGYWQHCSFALRVARRALAAGLAAATHAVFPFWLQSTASTTLLELAEEIRAARVKTKPGSR